MYVRPETFSLLFLSIFLAILVRWDRYPALAWLLPAIEVCWVNSQGLFVLGLDRPGVRPDRRRAATGLVRSRAEGVVADRRAGVPADRRGVPGQPLRDRRGALPAPARADDAQPDLHDEPLPDRRADADPALHPRSRLGQPAAAAPRGDDEPRRPELPGPAASGWSPSGCGPTRQRPAPPSTVPRRSPRRPSAQEEVGRDGPGRTRARLAAQPLPAPAVRRVQRPELASDAEQPPVRGGCGDGHGVELRRVGRRAPAPPRRPRVRGGAPARDPWLRRAGVRPRGQRRSSTR